MQPEAASSTGVRPHRPGQAPLLVDRIPLSAGVILLLGCGDGALGVEYRRRNPAAVLIGIEPDPTLAARASTVLDRVYCLDLATAPLPRFGTAPDCIVFGPGLVEQLAQPGEVLHDFTRLLAPGGVLVLCAPNGAAASGTVGDFAFDAIRQLLLAEALHPLSAEPAAAHTIWRAATAPVEPLVILSTMLPPVGGVSVVRVVEPLHALASEAAVATQVMLPIAQPPQAGPYPSIFILHRPALLGAGGLEFLRNLLTRGWLVVCEFDDHPSQIPILHRSDVQNFRAVHAIQTSTTELAAVLACENPEVAVFPNAISRLPDIRNFTTPDRLSVMFAALNREHEWPAHLNALNAAAAAAGPQLHFHVVADRAFFAALATPHKSFTPLCDYATYLDILSRCEVSFMPLRDTLFNRSKSDLKFLEAAAHRVVALASPVVYGDSITDGVDGVLFHDSATLRNRLAQLAANPAAACAIADAARAHVVRHRMLAYQVARRTAWYRDLWARRDELQRALLARVPELGPL